MITRQQAALLFSYDFKLVDKDGNVFEIICVWKDIMFLNCDELEIHEEPYFKDIGVDFFILAHPNSSLTKEINGVVPIVELCIKAYEDGVYCAEDYDENNLNDFEIHMMALLKAPETTTIKDAETLYSLHFLPSGIDQSNVKWIKD